MKSFINAAGWDRALRIVAGGVLLYLGWAGVVGGPAGLVFKVLGFLPLVTGLAGWCPAYGLFGVSTCHLDVGAPAAPKGAAT